jgi:DNA polymerase-4
MARALVICPDLKVVSSHFSAYHEASRSVMKILHEYTHLVEQISIDEAFLDVTEVSQPVKELAHEIQGTIVDELDLPNSLGVATNKLVAKIATDFGKKSAVKGVPPNAITIVQPGTEAEFLAPLPVEMLWGVGPKTATKLDSISIRTIGDLAKHSEIDLLRRFGKNGYELARRAKGIDKRSIVLEHDAKSISKEVTYPKDIRDESILRDTIERQSAHVARQLQKQGLIARTVRIKVRWPDFTTLTRQTTLSQPADDGIIIAKEALKLFRTVWDPTRSVRLLGVGVSGLDSPPRQIGLWDRDWEKERKIQDLLDQVHDRFGEDVLSRGINIAGKPESSGN